MILSIDSFSNETEIRFYMKNRKFNFKYFPIKVKVKVKFTLVQALRLCTGRTDHRGIRGIALTFHDRCTRRR
jgi:hypothetical protein